MTWKYKIGKKDNLYSVYEYIVSTCEDFDIKDDGICDICKKPVSDNEHVSWTEDPLIDNWYETKEELVDDLKLILKDLEDTEHFDY